MDEPKIIEPEIWVLDPEPNITIREMAEILRGLRIMAKGEGTLKRFHKSVHRHFKIMKETKDDPTPSTQ